MSVTIEGSPLDLMRKIEHDKAMHSVLSDIVDVLSELATCTTGEGLLCWCPSCACAQGKREPSCAKFSGLIFEARDVLEGRGRFS